MQAIGFGEWTLQPDSGELSRRGTTIRLQEQCLQVLLALLERPGQVVTRDELIARLWPHVVVDYETSLKSVIRKLRLALDDNAEQPRYIETLPRKGYRFIAASAPAAAQVQTEVTVPSTSSTRRYRARWMIATAALALAVILAITIAMRPVEPDHIRLGVLPFENLSPDPTNAFFADGLHEEVLATLANRATAIDVISRTTMLSYRAGGKSLSDIARELNLTHVLEGSVRRDSDALRVTVQLIDARKDDHVWSQTYDRHLGNTMTLQSQLAADVVAQLAHTLLAGGELLPSSNPAAYDVYLRALVAMQSLTQRSPPEDFARIDGWLSDAIGLDAAFAAAYAQRAQLYLLKYVLNLDLSDANREAARADIEAAKRLAGGAATVALARARFAGLFEGGPAKGLEALDIPAVAVSKEPNVLRWRAFYLCRVGRFEEGLATYRQAAALDPANASIFSVWERELWGLRRPAEALRVVQSYNEHGPGRLRIGDLEFAFTGNTVRLRRELTAPDAAIADDIRLLALFDLLRYEGRFAELIEVVTQTALDTVRLGGFRDYGAPGTGGKPIAELRGWAYLFNGDVSAAASEAQHMLAFIERQHVTSHDAWHTRMLAAQAALFSGHRQQAIAETRWRCNWLPIISRR